ncbi:MAG: hypothetical protein H6550_05400 [Chitinophagales bacterium]|nr:hypothetical protein [Chitinophagales bacterium]
MSINFKIAVDDIFTYEQIPDDTILREDMYQATFEQYVVDCGWYETDEGGTFITYLIKDFDWEMPVIKILTKDFENAKWSINVCKEYLENLFSVNGAK